MTVPPQQSLFNSICRSRFGFGFGFGSGSRSVLVVQVCRRVRVGQDITYHIFGAQLQSKLVYILHCAYIIAVQCEILVSAFQVLAFRFTVRGWVRHRLCLCLCSCLR
jgi:hypothetical protein